jgi:hypothetical protein
MKAGMRREVSTANRLVIALLALLVLIFFQWIRRKGTA